MKRILCILVALLFLLAVSSAEEQAPEIIAESNVEGRLYQLMTVEMSVDRHNEPMLLLTFRFTNGYEKPTRFHNALFLDAWQDGKSCEIVLDGIGIPDGEYGREVDVGATELFHVGILLRDTETPVDFELRGYSTPTQNWTIKIEEIPQYIPE